MSVPPIIEALAERTELGARVRDFDWSTTSLGPLSSWPECLIDYVALIAELPSATIIFWGEDRVQIYNPGYAVIMGPRHPRYFGARYRDCWPDTFQFIDPLMRKIDAGEVVQINKELIPVTRYGFTEETYFTFSFSPLRDAGGKVMGILQPINEVTEAVLGERRAETVRGLTPRADSLDPTSDAVDALAANAKDLPFFAVYAWDEGSQRLAPAAVSANLAADESLVAAVFEAASAVFSADEPAELASESSPWIARVPAGPWPESARGAWATPLGRQGSGGVRGVAVFGVSPRLRFDEKYRGFFEVVAAQVAAAMGTANALRDAQRRAEALAELDRAKTAFFSNVSHELRTPLTLLLGPVEDVLASSRLAPQDRALLETVDRNATRLLRLVNTLLDFSRIEAGRADAVYEPTDLGPYTAELASAFRAAVDKAGLRFDVECPPLGDAVAYVDRAMWEKIVLNLLSNALKHTFEGAISVSVRALDEWLDLTVRDTGVGIPAEELPHLFERFHRVRGARSRSHEGTGIGLALVQELVRLHGGQITAESSLGAGTTFTVSIPAGSAHLPRERVGASRALSSTAVRSAAHVAEALGWLRNAPGEETGAEAGVIETPAGGRDDRHGAAPARVLLADDNADMRDYVARLLRQRGDVVVSVADGRAALDSALASPPDLVLSDVMMPGLDGFGLLKALREEPRTREVPVILLSARAGEESRVEGLDAGADDYLVKPFSARELIARVGGTLALSRLRAETARQREALIRTLERTNQDLDQFAYVASHDLKAPLRGIANLSQWIEDDLGDRVPPESRQHLTLLRGRVHRLEALIDGILDYSRAARVRDKAAEVGVAPLLDEVIELLAPKPPARVLVTGAMPTLVAERVPLQQVFMNLVGNGLKYARRDDARVEVSARDVGGEWEFAVADNGPGIAPEYHERIWAIFQTLEARDKVEGTGVGLSVVQKIVETRGGRAWVTSEPGHGATFFFTWPKRPREQP